tara:strand:+ start:5838 stop:7136 length:1299 start_codon:yes stop_codon:yes gene_type:complete
MPKKNYYPYCYKLDSGKCTNTYAEDLNDTVNCKFNEKTKRCNKLTKKKGPKKTTPKSLKVKNSPKKVVLQTQYKIGDLTKDECEEKIKACREELKKVNDEYLKLHKEKAVAKKEIEKKQAQESGAKALQWKDEIQDFDLFLRHFRNQLKDKMVAPKILLTIHYHKPGDVSKAPNKNILNKNSFHLLDKGIVPSNAISIFTMEPYDEVYTKEEKKKFIVLHSCEKHCSNHGIFEKEELDGILGSQSKCPFCEAPFPLSSKKTTPPYGRAYVSFVKRNDQNWLKIAFVLVNEETGQDTRRTAYYPFTFEGLIAVYLVKKAFLAGKCFKMATSLTTGKYGVVYGNVHLRTFYEGGIENHAYSKKPLKDLNEIVLPNLISECNGFNIYSPTQIIDFIGKSALLPGTKELVSNRYNELEKEMKNLIQNHPDMIYFFE